MTAAEAENDEVSNRLMKDVEIKLLGTRAHALTLNETLSMCYELARGKGNQHMVINAAKIVSIQGDELLRESVSDATLISVDGQAVVWAARWLGHPVPERVAGIDLMHSILDSAGDEGLRIYFLGASQEVVEKVVEYARERGCEVAGYRNGYWNDTAEEGVVASIAEVSPDVLFLALPSPKKELFVRAHREQLNTGLTIGVGGSFDIIAGKTKRAPTWIQRCGLEWMYRLQQEPARMLKRYMVGNAKFVLLVLREKILMKCQ